MKIYNADTVIGEPKLELLRNISFNEVRDPRLAVRIAEELVSLSRSMGNDLYLHRGYFQVGNKKRVLGNLDESIEAFFRSSEAARAAGYSKGEGNAYGAIADIYSLSDNHANAMLYYRRAIDVHRKSGDTISLASYISNAGDEYLNHRKFDSALVYFREAEMLFEKANYASGIGYSRGNIGMVYGNIGENDLAEKYISEAISILQVAEDYYPICVYLLSMSDIYLDKGDVQTATDYAKRSLELARQYRLKEQISDACLKLSALHEKSGNMIGSYAFYKEHVAYRDSVNNIQSVQKMADLRTDYEVSKKQVEVNLLEREKKNQRNMLVSMTVILILTTVILGTLYWYYRTIAREKKRSERLLLNILPAATAQELKLHGKVEAVKFEEVTVLFTDFVKFSTLAEHTEPEQLVKSIDFYFKAFDEITTRHGLEKIKTIGDSYMCASGLPIPNKQHAASAARAAKEMVELVNNSLHAKDGLQHFEVRIGLHSGPVVAGIVGIKKWQYDIWGDTVNIASRMESRSMPGRINISETTWQEIKNDFDCAYRGEIEVKNRGLLKMYFLS